MIKHLFFFFLFLFLLTVQVSFIQALPFPFDRIPLLLVLTIYLYQYLNEAEFWWWLIFYGAFLDLLSIGYAPHEFISYLVVTLVLVLLARHVFTNRSFYSVAVTILLCVITLTLSQLTIVTAYQLIGTEQLPWRMIVLTSAWITLFAWIFLFFVFPFAKQARSLIHNLFF